MQPSAAPFMTGAFNFGTMTLSMLRARSNLFESCRNDSAPLMGGLYGQREHIPLPPTHLGRKNSICSLAREYFCFSIQDELCFFCCFKRACLKDSLDQQQATNSARR